MTVSAFVSSTFEDLQHHRTHVISVLRKSGIAVDPMEDWSADRSAPKVFSPERVRDHNLCVLLVAFRRGHIPEGELQSITRLEYRAAVAAGLDMLVFLLAEGRAVASQVRRTQQRSRVGPMAYRAHGTSRGWLLQRAPGVH